MNAENTAELMQAMGAQARAASARMAGASAAAKAQCLRELARLLRQNI